MNAKTFSTIDTISCIVISLFLLFLFIYPHVKLVALRDDITSLCDDVIEAANAEQWEEARACAGEIKERFTHELTLMRFIFDHEDVDNALDGIESVLLMTGREDATDTVIETENVKGIVTYLAGIETFTWDSLF